MALPIKTNNQYGWAHIEENGGKGSGNFGHAGRPGEVGGSAPSGSSSANYESKSQSESEIRDRIEELGQKISYATKAKQDGEKIDEDWVSSMMEERKELREQLESKKSGEGETKADLNVGEFGPWNCSRSTVSTDSFDILQEQTTGFSTKDYNSEQGVDWAATVYESHFPTKKDFASAAKITDGLSKLRWQKRDDSEWVDGSNSVGMLKEKIRGNTETILSEMASFYHGLYEYDSEKAVKRLNDCVSGLKKDISALKEKTGSLKGDRKTIANKTIKLGEEAVKLSGKTKANPQYYMLTNNSDVVKVGKNVGGSWNIEKED